ncbi:transglutaminase TgpA family protein [Granulosicoccus sp. 3-233]|uniref:transglutaminase TgpA family protein n=1 Tax=Granulosicoccus sp. 3-233 TaxID=3417969 RepID=UPI003D33DBC0
MSSSSSVKSAARNAARRAVGKQRWRRWLPDLGLSGDTPAPAPMDARTLYALAILLLLVQLPHLLHLPLWVSLSGATLIGLRLSLLRRPGQKLLGRLLSPAGVTLLAIACALLIKLDYGYFIGRDPCVAFLFILVAAKFAEVRRPGDATMLLCLAAFLLLTQYFYSQTILAALVTLPAVIALAHALAVLRDPENPAQTREQLKLVLTLLLQGLPLAALLFIVFPRLPGPLWSLPEDASATTGLSDSMSPGSIGQLSQSDAVAFRVEFDGAIPPPRDRYWRGPVLSEFDGRRWSVSPRLLQARSSYQGPAADIIDYTVTLQPHHQRWLFALDAAVSLPRPDLRSNRPIDATDAASDTQDNTAQTPDRSRDDSLRIRHGKPLGRLMSDGQMLAGNSVTQLLRYRQSSVLLDTRFASRQPPDNTLFLPGVNQRSSRFARELRDSVQSDTAYAQAILHHFNQQAYHYTLQPQLLGDAPVDEFLFDTMAGFCEHYAAAFVVLMRSAGIPARVVTGYLGGEMNDDYMIVRQSDAHAWAEAFIDGAWRRYDPTGAVAPSRVEQGLSAALPGDAAVPRLARLDKGWSSNLQLRWDALNHQWQRLIVDFDNDTQDGLWERLGLPKPELWQITVIVLALTGLWCTLVLGVPRLTSRQGSPDERLWQQLCELLRRRQLLREPAETPAEFLQRATQAWPAQARRLHLLQGHFSSLRFRALSETEQNRRRSEVRQLLRRLRWSLPRGAWQAAGDESEVT